MKLEGEEGEWELYTGPAFCLDSDNHRILRRKPKDEPNKLYRKCQGSADKGPMRVLCDHIETLEERLKRVEGSLRMANEELAVLIIERGRLI